MKYTFQHYLDISTSASSLTMIQINAGGKNTLDRIKHLFGAFKYIKYGKISVKLLPASTLPVDPLGLSYDSTDPQSVDPRDQMNPGLVRITNGEDIFKDWTGLSNSVQQQMYINTMLDPRWSKFMLQSGFKRSATPLYWNVGQLHQDPYPGTVINMPGVNESGFIDSTNSMQIYGANDFTTGPANGVAHRRVTDFSDPRGLFQTGHRGRMTWMPTDAFYRYYDPSDNSMDHDPQVMPLPEVECITVLLPKAYKTVYYYRMFITETVYLSGLKNTGLNDSDSYYEYRAIDNFMFAPYPQPRSPAQYRNLDTEGTMNSGFYTPKPHNDGGGEI